MTSLVQHWGMVNPRQVRIGSLAAVAGLVRSHVLSPSATASPFWIRILLEAFGSLGGWVLFMRISVAAPGWRGVMPIELDERETNDRHKAFVIAYRATGTLLLTYFYSLSILHFNWWSAPTAKVAFGLLWSFVWIHLAMPTIILAWRERRSQQPVNSGDLGDEAR